MWSNAFYQTLDLDLSGSKSSIWRLFGFNICRVIAHPSGRWVLETRTGRLVDAHLHSGWIAGGGRFTGLSWAGSDGNRYACALFAVHPEGAQWRRLLVRLRLPIPERLA